MKNILVNFTGRKGGLALYSLEMTRGMLKNGYIVSAIISSENKNINEWKHLKLQHLAIIDTYHDKMSFLINSIYFYFYKRYEIIKEFKDEQFDYIYCPAFALWSSWINGLFPCVPKYITLHDPKLHSGESWINRFFSACYSEDAKNAEKIIILSRVFRDYVKLKFGKNDEDILIVPHGVFSSYKITSRRKTPYYHDDKINFLFFGRIEKYKGIEVLLEAYKKLEMKYPDKVTLTIAGNGPFDLYSESFGKLHNATLVNRWIKDNEIVDFFTGKRTVVVLPYLDATQSGIVNIAMQNRALLIATNTGGLAEQLGDGKYGILIEPNNCKALYMCMFNVLNDYGAYCDLIEKGYESLKKLEWDVLVQKIWRK